MAVISKVVAPSKPLQHTADLYIEAMELVPKHDIPSSMEMMRQMQLISDAQSANPATSSEVACNKGNKGACCATQTIT